MIRWSIAVSGILLGLSAALVSGQPGAILLALLVITVAAVAALGSEPVRPTPVLARARRPGGPSGR